jgi:signal transduction histidine kinase
MVGSEGERIRRDKELLSLVNQAAAILLTASDEEKADTYLMDSIGLISRYIDIDRVYIYRNEVIEGELFFTLKYKWIGSDEDKEKDTPLNISFPYSSVPGWEERFEKGECVNGAISSLPKAEQDFYKDYYMKSVLVIPVFLQEQFWGIISYNDYVNERSFSNDEIEILRSASMMMVNAIHRSEQTMKIHIANERARLLLDSTPLCCEIWDQDLNLFDCNEEAVKLFMAKNKQELMEKYFDLSPEYQPDGMQSVEKAVMMLKKALEEGRCVYEWMHRSLNGTPIPCEITLVRVDYEDGYAIAAYNRDLREHKKMMREIEFKDTLLNAVNHAATILLQSEVSEFNYSLKLVMGMLLEAVDVDRVYIWKNYTKEGRLYCTQLYEWTGGAKPQQGSEITIDIPYDENMPTWEEELSKGNCINSLVQDMPPEEQKQLVPQGILSILVVPIFLKDSFWGFIGFDDCQKETLFSENEEIILRSGSLLIANAMLRNDITQELAVAFEEAKAASRAKSEFLSNMSHEIRTPLNAVIGMTSIGMSTDDQDRKQYCFNKIESASKHLLGVVNDVLDMSKIEAGKFELSPSVFNFEKMLLRVVDVTNFRIDEKHQVFKLQIDKAVPEYLIGDEQCLAQVITNLLGNAVKFTPENGEVRLVVNLITIENETCKLQIDVCDTGIGINEEQKSRLFQSFQQAESGTSRKFGGTGLGLVISKNIVEIMGGKMWVESEYGLGSVFSFTVELGIATDSTGDISNSFKDRNKILRTEANDDEPEDYEYLADMTDQLEGYHILLADDVDINREIALALFEPTLLKADCAVNGADAVRMFSEAPDKYDLIFMDIQMPEMDGYEATRRIRAMDLKKAKDIPIIAMTANVFREDIEKCKQAGMDDHIGKPFDLDIVMGVLQDYLGKA